MAREKIDMRIDPLPGQSVVAATHHHIGVVAVVVIVVVYFVYLAITIIFSHLQGRSLRKDLQ